MIAYQALGLDPGLGVGRSRLQLPQRSGILGNQRLGSHVEQQIPCPLVTHSGEVRCVSLQISAQQPTRHRQSSWGTRRKAPCPSQWGVSSWATPDASTTEASGWNIERWPHWPGFAGLEVQQVVRADGCGYDVKVRWPEGALAG